MKKLISNAKKFKIELKNTISLMFLNEFIITIISI